MTYSVKHFMVLLKIKRYINEFIIFINAKYKKRYILDIHINVLYTCTKQLKTFKPCLVYVVYIIKYWKKTNPKLTSLVSFQYLYYLQVVLPRPIRIPLSADFKIAVQELCFQINYFSKVFDICSSSSCFRMFSQAIS